MSLPQPSESFAWTQEPWGAALRCRPLLAVAPHLFTSSAVSVSRDAEDPDLAAVAATLGLSPDAVMQVHQVHGCGVVVCRSGAAALPASGDALASNDPQCAVGVRVADCVPVLLANQSGAVVAAVHAGWRGTAAGVVASAVRTLQAEFGVGPEDLIAAIGPAIQSCCYEVGPEVGEVFRQAGHGAQVFDRWFRPGKGDRLFLDVPRSNREQLESSGVRSDRIFDSGLCTACHSGVFHSHRRDGTRAGRALAAIRAVLPLRPFPGSRAGRLPCSAPGGHE